jgi:hypothetical protein
MCSKLLPKPHKDTRGRRMSSQGQGSRDMWLCLTGVGVCAHLSAVCVRSVCSHLSAVWDAVIIPLVCLHTSCHGGVEWAQQWPVASSWATCGLAYLFFVRCRLCCIGFDMIARH